MLNKAKDILSVKEQCRIMDDWLALRLKKLMPRLLAEQGISLWIVVCGEYNEDPVFKTLTPGRMQTASRTSCLMFALKQDGEFHALSLCRPNPMLAPYYEQAYDPKVEDQWEAIHRVMKEYGHGTVAVNVSSLNGMSDGLSCRLYERLAEAKVPLTTDTCMATRWLETRTDEELALYPDIYRIAMTIQAEAYSRDVIKPGITTTTDVEWFIHQRIDDMGLPAWFSPDVDVQRPGSNGRLFDEVIREGDLIHTDMGITYLGLCTDSQRLGYILKDGETSIPQGLLDGFSRGNRFQDIVRENMIEGRIGDEIFLASVAQGKAEGIRPMLYTHPIGFYGHGAGPLFGLYDAQRPVPDRGALPLHDRTCYALELNVVEKVPEWNNQDVHFYMEETVAFVDGETIFLDPEGREKITVI